MKTLTFIGLGLYSEKSITVEGLNYMKKAGKIYVESYSGDIPKLKIKNLEKTLNKKIHVLNGFGLKEERKIFKDAKSKDVVLLSPGDPFIATNHVVLRIKAEKMGIKTRVIHGVSIYSAALSLLGFSCFRFGPPILVSNKKFLQEKSYDVLKNNKLNGLHTLAILDFDPKSGKQLTINEALKILIKIEKRKKENVVTDKTLVVGLAGVGAAKPIVKAGIVKKILKLNFRLFPQVIVFPGRLHILEMEILNLISKIQPKILQEY